MEVSPERTASFHSTIFSEIVKRGRNSFFKPSVPFHQDPGAPDQGKVLDNFQNDVRSLYVSGLILQQGLHLCALKKTCPGNVCVCVKQIPNYYRASLLVYCAESTDQSWHISLRNNQVSSAQRMVKTSQNVRFPF